MQLRIFQLDIKLGKYITFRHSNGPHVPPLFEMNDSYLREDTLTCKLDRIGQGERNE